MSTKLLAFTLCTFFISFLYGQELKLGNYTYDNGSLTWQKVFESDLSFEEMKSKTISLPIIERIISEEDSTITVSCKRIDHNYRALGGTEMNTTIWVSRKSSIGNVVFQFKEGRYRVTFTNIILEQEYTVNAGIQTEEEGDQAPLVDYALKGNRAKWRGVFKNKDHKILDFS